MDPGDYETFQSSGWRGLIHPAWSGRFQGADPLSALRAQEHEVIRDRPSAVTLRVRWDGTVLYAKRMTALKDHERGVDAGWQRLRWRIGGCGALRTLDVCRAMERCGLSVPRVVLAARRPTASGHEELFVAEAADGAPFRPRRLSAAEQPLFPEYCRLLGRRIADLHRHGFIHGHLLLGHLFITRGRDEVVFIDNDENRRPRFFGKAAARRKNLEQLLSQLVHAPGGAALARAVLDAYFRHAGLPESAARSWRVKVLRNVRRRCGKSGGRFLSSAHHEGHEATKGTK